MLEIGHRQGDELVCVQVELGNLSRTSLVHLVHVFKGEAVSRSKPGKNFCPAQTEKNCGDMISPPGISPSRSSPAIARSWGLAVLWLPGFCIEGFPAVVGAGKHFLEQRRGRVCV